MNGTESRTNKQTRTDEQKDENYIPLSVSAGGIMKQWKYWTKYKGKKYMDCNFSVLI